MSKYHFNESDIYIQGTDIPKNRLNITDSNKIHEIERRLLEQAYQVLISQLNETTQLNETYFINLHKKTFQSLYEFADIYRNVNMYKGESQFCLAQHLQSQSKRIFDELAKDQYLSTIKEDKTLFSKKLAYYQGELIALHPFYELNGRITRLYCDILAIQNGYRPIDYSGSVDNEAYIEASIECVQYANSDKLEAIIYKGLKKLL